MLKNCDLQKNDVLLFVEFGENYNTEYEKIVKFLDRQHGKEYGDFFRKTIYSSELFYKIEIVFLGKSGWTEKTKTEFALVGMKFPNGVEMNLNVQTRYLKIKERKSKHFFTKIFMQF